jgi:hypothetical protein
MLFESCFVSWAQHHAWNNALLNPMADPSADTRLVHARRVTPQIQSCPTRTRPRDSERVPVLEGALLARTDSAKDRR